MKSDPTLDLSDVAVSQDILNQVSGLSLTCSRVSSPLRATMTVPELAAEFNEADFLASADPKKRRLGQDSVEGPARREYFP